MGGGLYFSRFNDYLVELKLQCMLFLSAQIWYCVSLLYKRFLYRTVALSSWDIFVLCASLKMWARDTEIAVLFSQSASLNFP